MGCRRESVESAVVSTDHVGYSAMSLRGGQERPRRALSAFDVACRWLSRAPRSQAEVAAYLTGRGFSAQAVTAAVGRLLDLRFLDDQEFGQTRARVLAERGYGDAWIERDLDRRGLSGENISRALASLVPEADRARQWWEGRRSARPKRSGLRALLERGFAEGSAERALGPIAGDEDEDTPG
jgi:regulatory protein